MSAKILNLLLIILPSLIYGQTILTGRVIDEYKKPAPNINLLLYPHQSQSLIAFAISDWEGRYRITVNSPNDTLRLEITSLQFRTEIMLIANQTQEINITLIPEIKDLDEFSIHASPIERRGDTISYMVSSFAREQDRSIADVLKQMPGIDVESSGRILYQGEPIQHFYVEGLDLMGGRYGLVSQNMPHRSVATVQVLENHQPIKILEERLPSIRSSLNITLQRDITTTGTARLGTGFTPLLWDANITPMMFTRNFQLAGSYQANNTGNDVAQQLDVLTMESLRERLDGDLYRTSTLEIPVLTPPGFNENRYLDNNLHMINANALQRMGRDMQLRTNLWFIHDQQQQQGSTLRTIYTPTDSLVFNEQTQNQLRNSALRGEFTLNRNTKDNYLNNKLEFQAHWDRISGQLFGMETQPISQQLRNPFYNVSNRMSMVKPLSSKLIQINSVLYFDQNPQTLTISPGVFDDVFNEGQSFNRIEQYNRLQRINTNQSASIAFGWKRWTIAPRMGFQYQRQWQNSDIETLSNENTIAGLFTNSISGMSTRSYLQTEIAYKKGRDFSLTIELPVSHVFMSVEDKSIGKGQTVNRLVADPRVSISFRPANFWQLRGSYGVRHQFGETESIHYQWIIKDLRSLQINNSPLQHSQRHSISAFIGHRNPIEGFFSSVNYFFSINNNNLIYSYTILPDGSTIMHGIEKANQSQSHHVNARTSKFFNKYKTTLSLQGSYMNNRRDLWVNELSFAGSNNIYTLTSRANIRITSWLNSELRSEWLYYDSWRAGEKLNDVKQWRYFGNLLVFPKRNQYLAIQGEYYMHENQGNYFIDLQYRYTITARKIDIDVKWVNVFNHKTYRDYYVGSFMLLENNYQLRPAQLLVSVKFSF